MKVLLTGASSFLGKRLLELLVEDPRIEKIHVVTRWKTTYPHPKVLVHASDLLMPASLGSYLENVDAIIHLAGFFRFSKSFSENYQGNLLPTLHLIDQVRKLKSARKPTILFASNYLASSGEGESLSELPISKLPSDKEVFAFTKALSERALSDSGLPARIFRTGVLVGDSSIGEIEKFDGPYFLMRVLQKMGRSPVSRWIKTIPVPIDGCSMIPLVPVNEAAAIFHLALFLENLRPKEQQIFGLYNSTSTNLETLLRSGFHEFIPQCEVDLTSRPWLHRILKQQSLITRIPDEILNYMMKPKSLKNPNFISTFGSTSISDFESYRAAFFEGYRRCFTGNQIGNKCHAVT